MHLPGLKSAKALRYAYSAESTCNLCSELTQSCNLHICSVTYFTLLTVIFSCVILACKWLIIDVKILGRDSVYAHCARPSINNCPQELRTRVVCTSGLKDMYKIYLSLIVILYIYIYTHTHMRAYTHIHAHDYIKVRIKRKTRTVKLGTLEVLAPNGLIKIIT